MSGREWRRHTGAQQTHLFSASSVYLPDWSPPTPPHSLYGRTPSPSRRHCLLEVHIMLPSCSGAQSTRADTNSLFRQSSKAVTPFLLLVSHTPRRLLPQGTTHAFHPLLLPLSCSCQGKRKRGKTHSNGRRHTTHEHRNRKRILSSKCTE